jgi:hypothetical protein
MLLVGKPEGKRPLGRSRRRWVDNIRKDLREINWGGVRWTRLVHKMLGNYPVALQLAASRVLLSSVELVSMYWQGHQQLP